MSNTPFFLSLRWKLAILFGCVFLLIHSIFSYIAYLHATDDFLGSRRNEYSDHVHLARALTDDSFLALEQLAEMLPLFGEADPHAKNRQSFSFTAVDEKWSQWQLSWDIENIVFFDNNGTEVKSWGSQKLTDNAIAGRVLHTEMPEHRIVCTDICFQQAVVPVIGNSKTVGAYGVTRSFADIMIKYKQATGMDIGILFPADALRESPGHPWPYRLAGMTMPERNRKLYQHIVNHIAAADLLEKNRTISLGDAVFEVALAPIQNGQNRKPLFLFIEDITHIEKRLHENIQKIWLYGVTSLLSSLMLLPILLHYTLSRVSLLSEALPLLAAHQYQKFRDRIAVKNTMQTDVDELDQLNQTALTLAQHLESLEQEVRSNTLKLIEKSRELATERDFIRQLIDTAPIIILTQKLNGIILTINQAGIHELGRDEGSIKGKIFDLLIPESEWTHQKKLNQLRSGEITGQLQIEGQLISDSGRTRTISWRHTLFNPSLRSDEAVVLTIGIDISERSLYEQKLLTLPINDPVTGLAGHQRFRDELAVALAAARRYDYVIALFFFDVDGYQEIVDEQGSRVGEMMLAWIAHRLKENLRSVDRIGRISDNIFALLASHVETDTIAALAEKLTQVISASPFMYAETTYRLGAHIGIAVYPEHGLTPNELYENADAARLQAKLSGSGNFHCCRLSSEDLENLGRLLNFRQRLERAIAQEQFVLQCQPVRQGKSSIPHHFECLLQPLQDEGTQLPPEMFLNHAEKLGLAGKIDRIALKKALNILQECERLGKDYRLSINLSGKIFEESGFFEDVTHLFTLYRISPAKIIFEISEAVAEAHFAQTEILIDQLKTLGCDIALYDFGRSFSAFFYLKHLPIDYVKIDGAFIREIDRNNDDQVFVKAISGVARTFGKLTIAKGVEDENVLKTLQQLEIDLFQGSLIGRPGDLI